jgi:hypothetical protein
MFFAPLEDDFSLTFGSPCINSGDPASPLDPDGTRADMGAIYFHLSAGFEFLPYMPTDFSVAHHDELLEATLSWTNPAVNMVGDPLTELLGVHIYRDGEFVVDITDVLIGQPSTYVDNAVPSVGMHEWEVIPYNSYGDGYGEDASAWIGLDTPGELSNVVATPDPNDLLECTITWDAPTTGEHGGYFPAGAWIGQKVYRNGILIADLLGTNNSHLDNTVPIADFYTYSVSYYNASGEGVVTIADPDPVFVGPPQYEVIPYDWVEISGVGTNTGITGDDQMAGPFNIGFAFPFYGYSAYSQIYVCSNGFTTFSSGQIPQYSNASIPSTEAPNNLVCPYWDDFYPPSGGNIYYHYDAPNNRFIIEFAEVPHISGGGSYTFEMILYPNGDIDLMYNQLIHGTPNSATVGIENADGTSGVQVTYNGSGPLNPENEMGIRVYSVSLGQPDVSIAMIPYGPPITIPASGGSFDFNISLTNNEPTPTTFDTWIMVQLPSSSWYGPVLGPVNLTLPGSTTIDRDRSQSVPATAPAGTYLYEGRVGFYPDAIWDAESFTFEKSLTGDGSPIAEWLNTGESFDDFLTNAPDEALPEVYSLGQNYPNPFNPATTLSFNLPEAVKVRLSVFDISGRLVATLADGWRQAGTHDVTFDATGFASGLYVYRLQAGDFIASGKMVLMK